jgi:O-antigen ligase
MQRGIGYMTQYPAFGLGIDNFARAECTISPKIASLRINGPMRCTAPHNSYVQAGAELGFAGLLIWASLVLGQIVASLRLRRRLPRSWLHGTDEEKFIYGATTYFALSMVGFTVTSFFVSFAWMDTVYLMAALFTGLYISAQAQFQGDRSGAGRSPQIVAPTSIAGWRVKRSAWRSTFGATA